MNLKEAREAWRGTLLTRALTRNNDNVTRAAEELGISRPTLYELMEKLGIGRKVRTEHTMLARRSLLLPRPAQIRHLRAGGHAPENQAPVA